MLLLKKFRIMAETKKPGAEAPKMKTVKNRGNHRVELLVNGSVIVFLPGSSVKVPAEFNVPQGLGLIER